MKHIIALICVLFVTACAMGPMIRPSEDMVPINLGKARQADDAINKMMLAQDRQNAVPKKVIWEGGEFLYDSSYYAEITGDDLFESRFDFYVRESDSVVVISTDGRVWGYFLFRSENGVETLSTYHVRDQPYRNLDAGEKLTPPDWVRKYSERQQVDYTSLLPNPSGEEVKKIRLDIRNRGDKVQQDLLEKDNEARVPAVMVLDGARYEYDGSAYESDGKVLIRQDSFMGPYVGDGFSYLYLLSTNNKRWGIVIFRDRKDMESDRNAIVIDFNGDGRYGLRLPLDITVMAPKWTYK